MFLASCWPRPHPHCGQSRMVSVMPWTFCSRQAQECKQREKHRGLNKKCSWVCLAAALILIGQRKGWRLSMTEQKVRKRISLQESVGLSKTIQTKSVNLGQELWKITSALEVPCSRLLVCASRSTEFGWELPSFWKSCTWDSKPERFSDRSCYVCVMKALRS